MKFTFLFVAVVFFNVILFAQFDSNTGSKSFSAPVTPSQSSKSEPSKFNFGAAKLESPNFPDLNAPNPKSISIIKNNDFVNPNKLRTKKLNTPEGEQQNDFKGDRFLGDFRYKGKSVRIVCRDYGEIDGDRVRVYSNDIVVANEIFLQGKYREIIIDLVNGFNKIDFQALNQGTSGPNTAEFVMYGDEGKIISSNQWNLTTGTKATLIVVKE